jgi:hypothetical protein
VVSAVEKVQRTFSAVYFLFGVLALVERSENQVLKRKMDNFHSLQYIGGSRKAESAFDDFFIARGSYPFPVLFNKVRLKNNDLQSHYFSPILLCRCFSELNVLIRKVEFANNVLLITMAYHIKIMLKNTEPWLIVCEVILTNS